MNKQPEVTDATREALITAFFRLAKIKNINKITIREITNLAGYNRSTFYRYFDDVYDLIEYSENDFLKTVLHALNKQRKKNDPIGDRQFFEAVIHCFHENADRMSILMSEQNRSHLIRKIKENAPEFLNRQFNDSPKKTVIRDIYFYGIFHAISLNLQDKDKLPDDALLDIIQNLFDNWFRPTMMEDEPKSI